MASQLWQRYGRLLLGLWAAALLALPAAGHAAVELSFYSKELGTSFPHAFVTMKGNLDSTGQSVDTSHGFTAKSVSPAILMGSVAGMLTEEKKSYIAKSDRQFSVRLTDQQYHRVMTVVEQWRTRPQPSYNLNKRNCVHFVGEVARAAGLNVTFNPKLMKKPRSFLVSVREANPGVILAAR